jgi:hypothetical protein
MTAFVAEISGGMVAKSNCALNLCKQSGEIGQLVGDEDAEGSRKKARTGDGVRPSFAKIDCARLGCNRLCALKQDGCRRVLDQRVEFRGKGMPAVHAAQIT